MSRSKLHATHAQMKLLSKGQRCFARRIAVEPFFPVEQPRVDCASRERESCFFPTLASEGNVFPSYSGPSGPGRWCREPLLRRSSKKEIQRPPSLFDKGPFATKNKVHWYTEAFVFCLSVIILERHWNKMFVHAGCYCSSCMPALIDWQGQYVHCTNVLEQYLPVHVVHITQHISSSMKN